MLKRDFDHSMFRCIFSWLKAKEMRQHRRISDHRATSLAVSLTLSGSLAPYRPIHSRRRHK